MHTYRKRTVIVLLSLMFVFLLIAIFAFIQLNRNIPLLGLGFSYYTEDLLVLGLSILSMIKVIYEIWKVEHHHEYERRVRKSL